LVRLPLAMVIIGGLTAKGLGLLRESVARVVVVIGL
jgi:hypothetical protein